MKTNSMIHHKRMLCKLNKIAAKLNVSTNAFSYRAEHNKKVADFLSSQLRSEFDHHEQQDINGIKDDNFITENKAINRY